MDPIEKKIKRAGTIIWQKKQEENCHIFDRELLNIE